MTTTTARPSLQDLTNEITAFASWEQFAERMEAGYVPTLRTFKGRSKANMKRNERTMILVSRLKQMGYRVFFNGETI